MNSKKLFVPLYYSIPMLIICLVALFILILIFRIEYPIISLQPLNAINVSDCGTLDQNDAYYVLNQSIIFNSGTCILITGNNSVFDGEYKHFISGNGGVDEYVVHILGENVSVLRLNLTNSRIGILTSSNDSYISNNIINATYGTGIGVGIGASKSKLFNNYIIDSVSGIAIGNIFIGVPSYYHVVENNTIMGHSPNINNPIHNGFDFGISLSNVYSSNITNNNIYKPNTLHALLINNSDYNVFSENRLNGPFVHGITYTNSLSNLVAKTKIYNSSNSAVHILDSTNRTGVNLVNISIFNTNVSHFDLESISLYQNISYLKIIDSYILNYSFNRTILIVGQNGSYINFTQVIDTSGNNLSDHIKIKYNYAEVKSNLNNGLNKSAIISFFGIPTNIVNPLIFRNGFVCPLNVCANSTALNSGTVIFNVIGWTNYTINYSLAGAPKTLSINEPDAGETYNTASFPVTFSVTLSENGTVKFSLNNGTINQTMDTSNNRDFSYVQNSLAIGNHTFIVYANFLDGQKLNDFVKFKVTNTSGSSTTGGSRTSGGGSSGGGTTGGTTGNGTTGGTTGNGTTGGTTSSSGGTTGGLGEVVETSTALRNTFYWLIVAIIFVLISILTVLVVRAIREKILEKNKTQFNLSNSSSVRLVSNLK